MGRAIRTSTIRLLMLGVLIIFSATAWGQNPTASGTINATLINKSGISIVFDSDASGVALGGAGTAVASLNFGTISAFGPLSAGVTRPSVTAGSFTVRTLFDVFVTQSGLTSTSYTLTAQLAAVAPTGLSYQADTVVLTTAAQTVQTNGIYSTAVPHNLDLIVSTAAPGAGGPAVGTPLTATINITATAN